MAESIEEIRKRKAREMLTAMAIDDKEKQDELMEMLPWSFRVNTGDEGNQFVEVMQNENVVCITADIQFADMIVEMLNRASLIQQAGLVSGEEE
tara:strand:- start:57 stop:338 length:282 start_codon:yes stop_codon:yes gene_type:complete